MKEKMRTRKAIRQVFSVILCLAICLSLVPVTAFATTETPFVKENIDFLLGEFKTGGNVELDGNADCYILRDEDLFNAYIEGETIFHWYMDGTLDSSLTGESIIVTGENGSTVQLIIEDAIGNKWKSLIYRINESGEKKTVTPDSSAPKTITQVNITGIPTPILGQPCTTEGYDSLIEVSTEYADAISKVSYEWVEENAIGGFYVDETNTFRDGEDEYGFAYEYELDVSIELNEGYEFSSEVVYGRKCFAGSISVDGDEILDNAVNTRVNDGVLTVNTKPVSAHTHKGVLMAGVPATCTADGVKDYYTCSCGKIFEDADCNTEIVDLDAWKDSVGKIAKKDHIFKWVIDQEATTTATGSKHEECEVCEYKKTAVTIDKLPMPTSPSEGTATPAPTSPSEGTATLVPAPAPTSPAESTITPVPVPTSPAGSTATPVPAPVPTSPAESTITPAPVPTSPAGSTATPVPAPVPTSSVESTITPAPVPTSPAGSTATPAPAPVPTSLVESTITPTPTNSAKPDGNTAGEVSEDNNTITITGNGEVQTTKFFEKSETNYESKIEWLSATDSTTTNKWKVTVKNDSDKEATISFDVQAKSTLAGQKLSDSLLTNTDNRQKLTASGIYMDQKTETVFNFVPDGDDLHATKEGISIAANSSKTFDIYFLMGESAPWTKTFAFDAIVGVKAELASNSGNPSNPSDFKDPSNNPTLDPIEAQHYENGVTNDHMNRYSIKGDKCIVAVRDAAGAYRGGETFYIYDGVSNTLVSSFVMEENSAHTHTVLCVPGQTYKFAISDKKFTTAEEIMAFCAKGTTEAITVPDKATLAEPYLQWEPQTPSYTINTITLTVKRPLGTMVDVYRDGKLITTISGATNKDGESTFVDKGLTASSSYTYKLVPFFVDDGVKWECTPKEYTVKTATAAKAFLNITKFDSNTVNITIAPNRSHVANGEVTYKIYEGKKLLKSYKEVGKKAIIYKYKKKGAVKKKFKVVTVCNTNKKLTAASPVRKSQKNTYKRTWGVPNVSNMKSYSEAYYPVKVTSDGKKITVTGYLLNSHVVSIKETGYINVYYDCVDGSRKYLGKKKVKATIANRSKKKVSFTIKLKKQLDVKNGSAFLIDSSKIEWKY